tara:strand:- start:173 stop:367 length:195 start_codon:yes stop_codon:yes gene_type:complete
MIKKIKSKLLTYLFTDWVKSETDVELLVLTSKMLKDREIEVTGIKPVLGFRSHTIVSQINSTTT